MPDLKGLDRKSRLLGGITPVTTPPAGISNPALCEQCNASLHVDDSFLKPALKTSTTGQPYLLDSERVLATDVYGGIDYVRHDQIPTLPDLSLAAESGCRFCAALRDGLRHKYGEKPWWKPHPTPLTLRIDYCWILDVDATYLDSIVVTIVHPEVEESQFLSWNPQSTLRFLVYAAREQDSCTKWLRLRKRPHANLWSPDNICLSQTWINECVGGSGPCGDGILDASSSDDDSEDWGVEEYVGDRHFEAKSTACQESEQISWAHEHTGGPFAPARLLDLIPVSAHDPGCINLVERIQLEKNFRYVALSYCWGAVKPTVLTTTANLDSHKQGIKLSDLPQCLRDAVTVARSLDTRYLWIDALCIIQDDSDDWARESSTMWQLFQNAYITIAAAASESFEEGFLVSRRSESFELDFSSALNPQGVGKIALSTIPDPRRYLTDNSLELELNNCKWDTRGWVWQEQKLAKRLLIFGKQMIHFKCDHCTRSEDGSNAYVAAGPHGQGHLGSWTKSLEDYTPKSFTFMKDRLPAISGLSKQIHQNTMTRGGSPAEYLAGIWYCPNRRLQRETSSWQYQLFWRISTPCRSFNQMLEQLRCADPQTYTAPSWSWASRSGGIRWNPMYWVQPPDTGASASVFDAKIEDHHMNLTGPDPTGRVGPGSYLKLSGYMYRDPLDLSDLECIFPNSTRFFWWNEARYDGRQCLDISLDWDHSPARQEDNSLEREVRFFGLWTSRDRRRLYPNGHNYFNGLLLFQDKVSGLYFRVGVFGIKVFGETLGQASGERQLQNNARWDRHSVCIV